MEQQQQLGGERAVVPLPPSRAQQGLPCVCWILERPFGGHLAFHSYQGRGTAWHALLTWYPGLPRGLPRARRPSACLGRVAASGGRGSPLCP